MRLTRSNKSVSQLAMIVCAAYLLGCTGGSRDDPGESSKRPEKKQLSVFTVNYPLFYFVERIGGDRVDVFFPAPPDIDPAFWFPDPEKISKFQAADVIYLNGARYAGWSEHVSLPPSRVVNTMDLSQERLLEVKGTVRHRHGPQGTHTHGEIAFTTWLDPTVALEQARVIAQTLSERSPAQENEFQTAFESLGADLMAIDAGWSEAFSWLSNQPILGSHPVYQYLAHRYELDLESVHFEPGEFPDEPSWQELERLLERHPAKWMLWEDQPLTETSARLVQLGIKVIVFRPAANRPAKGDFHTVMRENGENVRNAR